MKSEERQHCTIHYFTSEKSILGSWVDRILLIDWKPRGYFGYIFSLLNLSRKKYDADTLSTLKKISVDRIVPAHLPVYLEIELTPIWRSELASGGFDIFRKNNAGLIADYETKNVSLRDVDVAKLTEDDVYWAFSQVLDDEDGDTFGISLDHLVEGAYGYFLSFIFHNLGGLVRTKNLSRAAAIDLMSRMLNKNYLPIYFAGHRKSTSIAIDVKTESFVIPVIISELFFVGEANEVAFKGSEWLFSRLNVTELLKDYFPNADDLFSEIGLAIDIEVRAACAVAYMFHADRQPSKLQYLYTQISNFCTASNAKWFPQVCVWALTPLFKVDKEKALGAVALLFSAVNDQLEAQRSLEAGLALWREIDHAPVTTVFDNNLWKYEWN